MKVKMKLDLQSIKGFALEHGEKLALGVVAVVFLMFVYSALQREVLEADKQPGELASKAQQVRDHASRSAFDPTRDGLAVVEYADRARRDTVDVTLFAAPRAFNPPIADPKTKRNDPTLLPIEELRADSGFGVFALSEAGTGAAADNRKQKKGPASGGGASDAGHKPTADARLMGRPYVVVTGLVPRRQQAQEYARAFEGALGEDPGRDRPQYESCTLERAEIDPKQPNQLEWKEAPPSDNFVSQWETTMPDVVNDDLLEENLVASLGPLVGAKWGDAVTHPKLLASTVTESDIEYRLCRVFDFAVEPSKKYRYRIKCELQNPNHGLHVSWVKNPPSTTAQIVETAWSNSTGTVAIPDGFGVLAGAMTKDSRTSDPEVMLMVTAIDPTEGIEAVIEVTVHRASALDTTADRANARDPRDGEFHELENVDFRTGMVVVDIHGGEPLSPRKRLSTLTGPVEVLVRDRQGNLRVRNEFDDQTLVKDRQPVKEKPAAEKANTDRVPPGPKRPRKRGR